MLEFVVIDECAGLFFGEQSQCFAHLDLARSLALTTQILKHALQLISHLLHSWRTHNLHPHGRSRNFNFDFFIVQLAFTQQFAKALAAGSLFLINGYSVISRVNTAGLWQQ